MKAGIAAIAALILLAAPARAADFTGGAALGYSHASGSGVSSNDYVFGGTGLLSFSRPGIGTQISGDFERSSAGPLTFDLLNFDGDVFWRDRKGTLGISLAHHGLSNIKLSGVGVPGTPSANSYGAFGEWYAGNMLTFRIKAGAFSGDTKGSYLGTSGTYYFTPNISVTGGFDYLNWYSVQHASTLSLSGEIMPWHSLPLSVAVGFSHATGSGSSATAFGFSLKYRFGTVPGGNLADWDRSGPIQWHGAWDI